MTKLNQLTNADSPAEWAKNVNDAFGAELRAEDTAFGRVLVEVYEDSATVDVLIEAAHAQGMSVEAVNADDSAEFVIKFAWGGFQ